MIQLENLLFYDGRYIKTKMRAYGDKFKTNSRGLNVPDDGAKSDFFRVISTDSLLVYETKYYLQVY